jgi:hypothetical protein
VLLHRPDVPDLLPPARGNGYREWAAHRHRDAHRLRPGPHLVPRSCPPVFLPRGLGPPPSGAGAGPGRGRRAGPTRRAGTGGGRGHPVPPPGHQGPPGPVGPRRLRSGPGHNRLRHYLGDRRDRGSPALFPQTDRAARRGRLVARQRHRLPHPDRDRPGHCTGRCPARAQHRRGGRRGPPPRHCCLGR